MSARKAARQHLAQLLQTALVGPGLQAQAVYACQVGDFQGQTPVVAVTSGPNMREPNGYGCTKTLLQLLVYVFVAYAVPGTDWTEADAEDALDDIEEIIASVIAGNPRTDAWTHIAYGEPTQPDPVVIGGVQYRRELIVLNVEVF